MERFRALVRAQGMHVEPMQRFHCIPREDGLHFDREHTLELVGKVLACMREAPLLEVAGVSQTVVFFQQRLWANERVLLVLDQGLYYPVCPWCNKRATKEHLVVLAAVSWSAGFHALGQLLGPACTASRPDCRAHH